MPSPDNIVPVSLFYSCAHEDERLRNELAGQLCAEAVAGQVLVDRKSRPGSTPWSMRNQPSHLR